MTEKGDFMRKKSIHCHLINLCFMCWSFFFNKKSFHKIRPTGKKLEILIQKNQISKVSVILYKKGGQALFAQQNNIRIPLPQHQ